MRFGAVHSRRTGSRSFPCGVQLPVALMITPVGEPAGEGKTLHLPEFYQCPAIAAAMQWKWRLRTLGAAGRFFRSRPEQRNQLAEVGSGIKLSGRRKQ